MEAKEINLLRKLFELKDFFLEQWNKQGLLAGKEHLQLTSHVLFLDFL